MSPPSPHPSPPNQQSPNLQARRRTIMLLLLVVGVGLMIELFLIWNSTTPYHSDAVEHGTGVETLTYFWDGHVNHTWYAYEEYPWLRYLIKGGYAVATGVCFVSIALAVRRRLWAKKSTSTH